YNKILILFLQKHKNILDIESKNRLYTNPLRILDSKNANIKKILEKAPLLSDYINILSQKTFKNLCNMLDIYGINYIHNKYLVRGLDYYNDTVFEWTSNFLGSQNTICAGGRYNSLIEELGGKKTSGIGFAIGMERLVLLSQLLNIVYIKPQYIDVY
ncbi:ATP phosphoribosyltransferase regulatory subunit, partial [Buchnera aphidicola]|nr:ATP phosphoribosyltransferase regulatory subunit [Buchnera aphidicola]